MPARRVLVDLVLELPVGRLQRLDEVLHLQHVHVLVVRRGVNEQRRLELLCVPGGRAATVLVDVFVSRLADVVRRREQVAVALILVAHPRHQVAHRHTRVADLEILGMREQVHERDQPAVAPTHDADALRVDDVVVLQHPLLGGENVVDFQAAVVDQLPEILAVAGAAAVVRRDDRVALLQQLAQDVDVARVEVAVDAAVHGDHQRQLGIRRALPGQERVGAEDHRVARALARRVLDDARRRPGETHLVYLGEVFQAAEESLFVHAARHRFVGEPVRLLEVAELLANRVHWGFRFRLRPRGRDRHQGGADDEATDLGKCSARHRSYLSTGSNWRASRRKPEVGAERHVRRSPRIRRLT